MSLVEQRGHSFVRYADDIGWFIVIKVDYRNKKYKHGIRGKNGHFLAVKVNPENNAYTLIGWFRGKNCKVVLGDETSISCQWHVGVESGKPQVYVWDKTKFKPF